MLILVSIIDEEFYSINATKNQGLGLPRQYNDHVYTHTNFILSYIDTVNIHGWIQVGKKSKRRLSREDP